MNQTAVEWLVNHFLEQGFDLSHHKLEIEQAKEIEKQQIIEAHNDGGLDGDKMGTIYYNELFKK